MKRIKIASLVILPLGMLAIIVLEALQNNVRTAAGITFNFLPIIVFTSVFNLFYATILLAMFWLTQKSKDWRIGIVYLIIGLFTFLSPILQRRGYFFITKYIPLGLLAMSFDRGLWLLGSFITVIGAWAILSGWESSSKIEK